jgi:putative peptidoglycan lipid II flippase
MQVPPENPSSGTTIPPKRPGLLRASVITSGATFVSRILGLVREIVFAAWIGDGAAADTFFVAFKIPNFLRRLFAEGAFAQAFVPVLSEYRMQRVAGNLGLALLVITVLGVLAASVISAVFAPGYLDDPEKFTLLVATLRITFPYLLLISLTGFAGAILNSYGHFAAPAMTPIFLNLTLIGSALLLSPLFAQPTLALAWGVLLAGLIQLMFQLPFLIHLKLVPRPRLRPAHEGVRKVLMLMLPVMFSVSVGQINLLLDTVLATSIDGDGSVSWLYYSDRLMELPLGIFGIAIATVILPALSRMHSSGTSGDFSATLEWGLRTILVLGVPACVALVVLAEPLVITLYQRGQFGVASVLPTARSLQAYALGLLAFMAIKILATAWFARQDTRTPVRIGVIAMVCNMVLNLALILPLAHVGLALATSLAAFLNAGLLLRGLLQQRVLVFASGWWAHVSRVLVASSILAAVLMLLAQDSAAWFGWSDLRRTAMLGLLCTAGGLGYVLALLALGLRPAHLRM